MSKPTAHANVPGECDLCRAKFQAGAIFIDGKTDAGPWADMCEPCYEKRGIGLGAGKGQKYQVSEAGNTYVKIEG